MNRFPTFQNIDRMSEDRDDPAPGSRYSPDTNSQVQSRDAPAPGSKYSPGTNYQVQTFNETPNPDESKHFLSLQIFSAVRTLFFDDSCFHSIFLVCWSFFFFFFFVKGTEPLDSNTNVLISFIFTVGSSRHLKFQTLIFLGQIAKLKNTKGEDIRIKN